MLSGCLDSAWLVVGTLLFRENSKEKGGKLVYMLSRQYSSGVNAVVKPQGKGKGGKKTTMAVSLPPLDSESNGNGTKKKMTEQEVIQRVLKNYDWRVRPYGQNDSAGGK